jgi:hypothetical protein
MNAAASLTTGGPAYATNLSSIASGTEYSANDEAWHLVQSLRNARVTEVVESALWAAATQKPATFDKSRAATIRMSGSGLDRRTLARALRSLAEAGSLSTMSGLASILSPGATGAAAVAAVAIAGVSRVIAEQMRVVAVREFGIELEAEWPKFSKDQPPVVGVESAIGEAIGEGDVTNGSHARLAREIRDMTALPAAALGEAFGVSREQYSRWISGNPISVQRHGQLQFVHTLIRDLVRKLGANRAKVWLQTSFDGQRSPKDLLTLRRFDDLYRRIVELPDPRPVENGTIVALRMPDESVISDEADEDDEQDAPWSPYDLDAKDA